jgi:5-hydroxyisourate hydrolase
MSSPLTTHVLDTAHGRPAVGVPVRLERRDAKGGFLEVTRGVTDDDGRIVDLLAPGQLEAGVWRMTFDTDAYFDGVGVAGFYPYVQVVFEVTAPAEHHHVPLLLSPYGYSTYRGS